jgi:dolichol kinase
MATEKIILPFNGRGDQATGESVFTRAKRKDISIKGEIYRKLIHLGAIVIPLGYYFCGFEASIIVLSIGFCVSVIFDYSRIFGNEKSRNFVKKYFGILIRSKEEKSPVGATFILAGSLLAIILFDKPIAIAGITFIIVGDTAGAIIGRLWGIVKFRTKSLEGSISFFLACVLVSIAIPGIPFWVKVIGAFCATIVEAITLHIDDNLIVPITSAALMQVVVSQMIILEHFS